MSAPPGTALLLGLAAIALAPQEAEVLRFAVLGHIRGTFTGEQHFLLDEIVREVAETHPDLLFLAGDLIFGDINQTEVDRAAVTADWDELDRALAPIGAEIHRTPGNHDINDPVTRDIWLERYGPPGETFRRGNSLFVVLSSRELPGDEPVPVPRGYRPTELARNQLEMLRTALADPSSYDHAFVVLHHELWFAKDARWWDDVHPLLVAGKVRAVFAGDLSPLKFTHVSRDGIEYVQTAFAREGPGAEILRGSEIARQRQVQLDCFPLVTIRKGEVDIEIRTIGALTSNRLTPTLYREGIAPAMASRAPLPTPPSTTPWGKLLGAALVGGLLALAARAAVARAAS